MARRKFKRNDLNTLKVQGKTKSIERVVLS